MLNPLHKLGEGLLWRWQQWTIISVKEFFVTDSAWELMNTPLCNELDILIPWLISKEHQNMFDHQQTQNIYKQQFQQVFPQWSPSISINTPKGLFERPNVLKYVTHNTTIYCDIRTVTKDRRTYIQLNVGSVHHIHTTNTNSANLLYHKLHPKVWCKISVL